MAHIDKMKKQLLVTTLYQPIIDPMRRNAQTKEGLQWSYKRALHDQKKAFAKEHKKKVQKRKEAPFTDNNKG